MTERIFLHLILTDQVFYSKFFIFICKPESCAPDSVFRDAMFEVIIKNDVLHRFGTSHTFREKYGVRNEYLKKKLGCFSIENIEDPCVVTVAVNPKQYFQEFESRSISKKHKGLRKEASGVESEDYAKRINSIGEIETFG